MSQSSAFTKPAKRPSMSAVSIAEHAKVDSSLARFERLIPDHPYILSVPNFDLPLKRPHELALEESRWIRDSPFGPEEAHLQYMTFLLRDTSDSCFELRTQVDEEREQRMRERDRNGTTVTGVGVGTQKTGPAKKKISLAAYKEKKEKGYVSESKPSPELEKPSPPDTTEAAIAPTRQPNGVAKDKTKPSIAARVKDAQSSGEFASRKTADGMKKRRSPEPDNMLLAERPSKKSRPNTPINLSKNHDTAKSLSSLGSATAVSSSTKSKADHGLPPLLSPGRPKKVSLPPLHSPPAMEPNLWIPPLLSPTIDPELEEDLRKMKTRGRADSDLSSLSDPHSSKYPTPSKPEKGLIKMSSPEFRKAQHISEKFHSVDKALHKDGDDMKAPSEKKASETRLIIKLKYGRKLRKEVERILKSSQKSSRPILGPAFTEQPSAKSTKTTTHRDDASAGRKPSPGRESNTATPLTAKKVQTAVEATESFKKRFSESKLPEKPAKKLKPSALPNGTFRNGPSKLDELPVTPVQDEFDSRKLQILVTPKDVSAASMARSASNNSHMSTPRNITPLPPPRVASTDRIPKASSNTSGRSGIRIAQLSEYSKRFNTAGRDLKHQAQKIAPPRSSNSSSATKQAAVMMLESVMAYMMAYTYQDHVTRLRGQPDSWHNTWYTLFPFVDGITQQTKHYPDLEALRNYLAYAIGHKAIGNMLSYMVASTSSPPASTPVASGAEQHQSPESNNPAQPPPVDTKLPSRIVGVYTKARVYVTDASSHLAPEDIAKRYPKTWAAREQRAPFDPNAHKKEREDMMAIATAGEPGGQMLHGPFWLPITEAMTPAQAVRFGVALCTEWMRQEGIKYEIGLGK
jgi:hypothetical protein